MPEPETYTKWMKFRLGPERTMMDEIIDHDGGTYTETVRRGIRLLHRKTFSPTKSTGKKSRKIPR